jgi:hypothetical protein
MGAFSELRAIVLESNNKIQETNGTSIAVDVVDAVVNSSNNENRLST